MGCGASAGGRHGGRPSKLSAMFGGDFEDGVPQGIVMCSATRPDWNAIDYLVFESKDHMESMNSPASDMSPMSPYGSFNNTWDDDSKKEEDTEKSGRFFSNRQQCVGTWRIMGNVLTLIWPFTSRSDTVIAVKSDRQWVNQQTDLTVDVYLPDVDTGNPDWFKPDLIAEKFQSETVSSKSFECPVCFFELFKFPTGVIRLHSRRCCGHYFHRDCAHYLLRAMQGSGRPAVCPLCGVTFSEVKTMPDLAKDPRDWFAVCDVDFGGELDSYEVIEALGCVLPVNRHRLEKNVKAHWHEWDPDGDGTITLNEFVMPQYGLKDWILKNIGLLKADAAPKPNTVPSIDANPREWFHYWDRDGSGTLEKDEVVRALLRTFCRDENGQPHLPSAHDMREVAEKLWEALGYSPFDAVNFEEFIRPYGIMDQFLHNQTHCAYFGVDAELIAS